MTLTPAADPARGVVSRTLAEPPSDLIELLTHPTKTLSFLHKGDGIVAEGEFARFVTTGADAAADIQRWFSDLTAGWFGRPLMFVSLGFSAADESVAVVPLRWWQRGGINTTGHPWTEHRLFGAGQVEPDGQHASEPVGAPGAVRFADDAASVAAYRAGVVELSRRIANGELVKAVLSRTAVAHTERPIDERFLLGRLAARNPSSYTYSVAGLVGASPELLVRRNGSEVFSRVLAGTAWRTGSGPAGAAGADADAAAVARLQASAKEHAEHHWAVESAQRALQPYCRLLTVPEEPSALQLADLVHLATDLHGMLSEPAPTALALAASLHPTAAVGGTPEDVALQAIAELEPEPRGRYAGAVGWQDGTGDGEFALALRCAEIDGNTAVLHAGGGIVAGSDPEVEASEAAVKMLAIRHALTG
ncbi:chorismate-binding protein [Nakamurella aerolata]|uniref:Isochorismate synthase n=1 Tax=Nakamurella aerolata TaxID=1656892 RepID=A0A849A374_9ACTN|nr:isochorismate synthase [Nakamurella aerolata]